MTSSTMIREHVRHNVVGYLAVFLALTGTAVALPGKNTVDSGDIINKQVKAADLGGGAVKRGKLANAAVTGAKVAPDSLSGAQIDESSLGQVPQAANAGQLDGLDASDFLGTDATAGGDLSGTFSNLQLGANSVGTPEITVNGVDASEIAPNAVGASEIANDAVGTSEVGALPAARVTRSSAQSIPDVVGYTTVTFDTEDYDVGNMHSTTSNTNRVVAPVAGLYAVTAGVCFAENASGFRIARLTKDGILIDPTRIAAGGVNAFNASGLGTFFTLATVQSFGAGEYVELAVDHNVAGPLDFCSSSFGGSHLTMTWLAPAP